MSRPSASKIPPDRQSVLRTHGFRFRRRYPSGIERWEGCLTLYVQPEESHHKISQLLKLCWQVGYVVGQDTERLRISREFNIELDDLIFGKDQ